MSLFQTLKPKPKHPGGSTCLLLDISGSMATKVRDNDWEEREGFVDEPRKIELLFKAVRETPECASLKAYVFSTSCRPLEVLPTESEALNFDAHGGTDMAEAFRAVKAAGFYSAILVTDGEPDSESAALAAAYGMKLGIIYIGPQPVPEFLKRLADATDGTFAIADMSDIKQLESAIVAALPAPEDVTPPKGGGAISL